MNIGMIIVFSKNFHFPRWLPKKLVIKFGRVVLWVKSIKNKNGCRNHWKQIDMVGVILFSFFKNCIYFYIGVVSESLEKF